MNDAGNQRGPRYWEAKSTRSGSSEARRSSRCNFVKHGQTVGDCGKRGASNGRYFWGLERSVSMKRLFDTVTVVDACGLSVVGLETGCAERRRAAPI